MIFSKTAAEIFKRAWYMDPTTAFAYLDVVANILDKKQSDFDPKPEAISIRQAITPEGMIVPRDEEIPEGSVGIVSIMGPMMKYGDWCSYGSDDLVGFAKEFEANENIVGQIWLMDSGGGSVASVSPYLDFLDKATKPVVTLSEMSASANYYIASATDYIMAENNISAMFGSIGVMIEFADFKKYYEDKGIKIHSIYSTLSEHKNNVVKEAFKDNYEPMQKEMLDPLAKKFQDHVKAARPGLKNVEGVLSGKMFYADEALSIGLIDGIGNLDTAIEKVKFLASARSFISTNY